MTFNYGWYSDKEYPIFDVRYISGMHYHHKHRVGFTGEIHRLLYIQIYLFRYQIFLDFEWGFDNISKEESKRLFKERQAKTYAK